MLEKLSVGFGCWCFFAESSAAITRLPVRDHGIITARLTVRGSQDPSLNQVESS